MYADALCALITVLNDDLSPWWMYTQDAIQPTAVDACAVNANMKATYRVVVLRHTSCLVMDARQRLVQSGRALTSRGGSIYRKYHRYIGIGIVSAL